MRHTFRYLVDDAGPGREVVLGADDAHHLARVVRRRPGDEIELIDASGVLWPAVVVKLDPAVVLVGDAPRHAPDRLPVDLAVGLADWGRLDLVVEKATELGVPVLTLFASERAGRVPEPAAFAKRRERMLRVAESAARQSGHAALPEVVGIVPFAEVVRSQRPTLLVDPGGERGLVEAVSSQPLTELLIVVGPDAGFSEAELGAARDAGVGAVRLGDAILRTETAAIVAVSVAAAAMGALGGP